MDFFRALYSSRSDFVRYCTETTGRNLREPAWLIFWALLAALILFNGLFRS